MLNGKLRMLGLAALLAGVFTVPAQSAQADTRVALGGGSGIFQRVINTETRIWAHVCTLTAVGNDAAGNLVALTNAHCFIDEAGNKLVGDKVYADHRPHGSAFNRAPDVTVDDIHTALAAGPVGEVTYVGESNHLLDGGGAPGLDYAVIKLDPAKVTPTTTVTSPAGTLTIKSVGTPPGLGARMCKQGHRTGLTCGYMLGTAGIWFRSTIVTDGGDSGSPTVYGTTLVGNAFGAFHHTPILSILADMNARGGVGAGFQVTT